MSYMPIIFTFR